MDKPEKKKAAGNLRGQILEAALKVFGERGFERSSTKAIAKEAGVAEGTIFNYFPTKKDILFGFLEEEVVTPLSGVLHNDTISDLEIIKNFFKNRLQLWRENQAVLKVMIAESLFNKELAEEFRKRIFEPGIKEVICYITGRAEAGTFRKIDASVVARSLAGTVIWFGLIQHTIISRDVTIDDDETTAATLASFFLMGLTSSDSNE